ncbi:MAG: pyrimidine reductase family protein [Acidimicrobiales bacterium]
MIRSLIPDGGEVPAGEELERRYERPAPYVRANFVAGLDGAVELDGRSGGLSGGADHAVFTTLRALADVVLVGSGTVRAEGYGPVRLGEAPRARRVGRHQAPVPLLAVVSDGAHLDPDARIFSDQSAPRPLIFVGARAAGDRRRALAGVAEVVVAGEEWVAMPEVLAALGERGLTRVLCEGGPEIFGRLVGAGRLDELCLTHAPILAGAGRRSLATSVAFPPVRLVLRHLLEGDGLLLARYDLAPALP